MQSQPIPADLNVPWKKLHYHESRVLAGMMLNHGGELWREWRLLDISAAARIRYRAACNAVRRLVPCRWLVKVRRGVYRLSEMAVETLTPKINQPNMTIEKLVPRGTRATWGAWGKRARSLLEE